MNFKLNFISSSYKWDYFWLTILFSITIFFSILFFENFNASTFAFDSTLFINVANNLLNGNGYVFNFVYDLYIFDPSLGYSEKHYDVDTIISNFPDIFTIYGKPPLFILFLAGFFNIFSANPENWIFYGALLSTIISISFIFSYYIFCKKYFGTHIAIFSSSIIVFSMTYLHFITTSRPNPLIWFFIVSSFLFLKKTTSNFFLFGLLTGLGTLTHPIAMISGISYLIYLLLKKQFKGFCIILITWFSISFPWFIRQLFEFENFAFGYSIPFTKNISHFFLETTTSQTIPQSQVGSFFFGLIPSPFEFLNSFFLISPWIRIFDSELIIFFIFFTIFSFISLKYIIKNKNILKFTLLILCLVILIVFLISNFYENIFDNSTSNDIFEIILIISIPIGSIFVLNYVSKGRLFLEKLPKEYYIFTIFGGLSILAGYFSLHSTIKINHFLMFPFFLILLPLGINGWKKFVNEFSGLNSKKTQKIAFLSSISLLIFVYLAFTVSDNIAFYQTYSKLNDQHMVEAYSWIRENIERDQVLANLEQPSILFLKTGNPTVIIPEELHSIHKFNLEKILTYIEHYDIEYFVIDSDKNDLLLLLNLLDLKTVMTCGDSCRIFTKNISDSEWSFSKSFYDDNSIPFIFKNNLEEFQTFDAEKKSVKIEQIKNILINLNSESTSLEKDLTSLKNNIENSELLLNSQKSSYQKFKLLLDLDIKKSQMSILNSKLDYNEEKKELLNSQISLLLHTQFDENYQILKNNVIEKEKHIFTKMKEISDQDYSHKLYSTNLAVTEKFYELEYQSILNFISNTKLNLDKFHHLPGIPHVLLKDIRDYEKNLLQKSYSNHQYIQNYRHLFIENIVDIREFILVMEEKTLDVDSKYFIENQKIDDGIEYFDLAISVSPDYVFFYEQKLDLVSQTDFFMETIEVIDKLLGFDKFDYALWIQKAKLLEKIDQTEKALDAYSFALKISPEEKLEVIELKILELQNQTSHKKEFAHKTLDTINNLKDTVKEKFSDQLNTEESKEFYLELLKQEIDNTDQNSYEKLVLLYNEVLKYENDIEILQSKAMLLEKLGKLSEAIETYKILMNLVSVDESREIFHKVQQLQNLISE